MDIDIKDYYNSPDQSSIVNQAIEKTLTGKSKNDIKSSVDNYVMKIHDSIYEIYKSEEKNNGIEAMRQYFNEKITDEWKNKQSAINAVTRYFSDYNKFFLSLSQARKSRAGKTFEYILKALFDKCEIPYSYQPVVNGNPDFIIPGKESYLDAPQNTLVVTLKRTTKERWRQVSTEGARGYRFFLATIDKKITNKQLDEMAQNQVTLLIPEHIINEKKIYRDHSIVYNYKELFTRFIPQCLELWNN